MPVGALEAYESLRAAVLGGHARAAGLGSIAFHGLWGGLTVLLTTIAAPQTVPHTGETAPQAPFGAVHDRQLVRLLANMVLQTQSEVQYAY